MRLEGIIAGAGFEPCDLRVMGPARTPGSSTPLSIKIKSSNDL